MTDATRADALPAGVLDQAIGWMVRLQSGTAGTDAEAACLAWRRASPRHEQAWQALQASEAALARDFSLLPPAAPGILHDTLANAQRLRQQRSHRRRTLKTLGLAGGALALGALGTQTPVVRRTTASLLADAATRTGERRTLRLDDGTTLHLNTATAVDLRFDARERRVVLHRGELYAVTASSGEHRPFVVETPLGRYEALGTRFALRIDDAIDGLYVDAGRVAMRVGATQAVAQAGEQYRIDQAGPRPHADAQLDPTGWVDGALVARQMPLPRFLGELARYRPGWLRADPALAPLQVSGVFQLDDTDRVLDALARTLPVRIERHTRYWVQVRG